MAEITHVSAVWPGWGHASENPELPDALKVKGIIFLGPPSAPMSALGDKIGSSLIAQAAGVPTLQWSGSHACVYTTEEALASCQVVGYPAMIKASWGGGGKGIRKVHNDEEVKALFKQVQGEVPGSPIFVMKLASQSRHLEVQLLCDQYENVAALHSRDCSVQRRHQKMAEITHVSAVWPGWGHASENPELPDALKVKGIIFLGPPATPMSALGDKIGSSLIAQAAGVPTLQWSGSHVKISPETCLDSIPDDIYRQACVYTTEEALATCQVVGYPAMIKASCGGGGKGIRKVHNDEEVKALFKQVQGEVPGSPIFVMKLASQIQSLLPIYFLYIKKSGYVSTPASGRVLSVRRAQNDSGASCSPPSSRYPNSHASHPVLSLQVRRALSYILVHQEVGNLPPGYPIMGDKLQDAQQGTTHQVAQAISAMSPKSDNRPVHPTEGIQRGPRLRQQKTSPHILPSDLGGLRQQSPRPGYLYSRRLQAAWPGDLCGLKRPGRPPFFFPSAFYPSCMNILDNMKNLKALKTLITERLDLRESETLENKDPVDVLEDDRIEIPVRPNLTV
ncbi:Acetyl-CoA carboxylase 1 [Platanthera guangdongensis]|uniref:Acetyl-CoA carboxylase 1 n=1 Tax=Platanthera guangdongensis TaxID=2320717 RepID=A0ABR2LRS2_9ASPA